MPVSPDRCGPIALVFADVLQQVGVRRQQPLRLDGERPGEHFRIVDGHFEIHVAEVATPEAFRDAKRFGLWMSGAVEPAPVVEPRGGHDQRVPLPSSDRVSQPGGIGILGKIAAIGEHGSMRAVGRLVQHHDQRRSLDDPGQVEEIVERDADGEASREGTVLPGIPHALQEQRLGPGLNVLGLEILGDVEAVEGPAPLQTPVRSGLPSAVRGAGAERLGLPSGRRGIPGVGVIEPLRSRRRRQKRRQDGDGDRTDDSIP